MIKLKKAKRERMANIAFTYWKDQLLIHTNTTGRRVYIYNPSLYPSTLSKKHLKFGGSKNHFENGSELTRFKLRVIIFIRVQFILFKV